MAFSKLRYHGTVTVLVAAIVFAGCGGGGGGGADAGSPGPPPATVSSAVAWTPPLTYSDNAVLDPTLDLNYYEIYLRSDKAFSDNDQPVAIVSATYDEPSPTGAGTVKQMTTEFGLDALVPFAPQGPKCFISIRAVGVDGQKSGFMAPVSWDKT